MKPSIYAATASVLLAAGSAAAQPAGSRAVDPVLVLNHDTGLSDRMKRNTAACVDYTQAGRYKDALSFCNRAIRIAESGTSGAAPDTALAAAVARSNRAVVSWLLGHDDRAAADLAVAATHSPGAGFVQKNIVAMGLEAPASSLAGGETD